MSCSLFFYAFFPVPLRAKEKAYAYVVASISTEYFLPLISIRPSVVRSLFLFRIARGHIYMPYFKNLAHVKKKSQTYKIMSGISGMFLASFVLKSGIYNFVWYISGIFFSGETWQFCFFSLLLFPTWPEIALCASRKFVLLFPL